MRKSDERDKNATLQALQGVKMATFCKEKHYFANKQKFKRFVNYEPKKFNEK